MTTTLHYSCFVDEDSDSEGLASFSFTLGVIARTMNEPWDEGRLHKPLNLYLYSSKVYKNNDPFALRVHAFVLLLSLP